jgi:hypothetical protein
MSLNPTGILYDDVERLEGTTAALPGLVRTKADGFETDLQKRMLHAGSTGMVHFTPDETDGVNPKIKIDSSDTTQGFLAAKLLAGTGLASSIASPGGNESMTLAANIGIGAGTVAAGDDSRFFQTVVDGADTTPGNLTSKILAGTGLTKTIDNPSGNEDISLSVEYGTTAGTALQGNDPSVTNARTPTAHNLIDATGHPVSGLTPGQVVTALTPTTYGFSPASLPDGKVFIDSSDTTKDFLTSKLLVGNNLSKTIQNPGGNENILLDFKDSIWVLDDPTVIVSIIGWASGTFHVSYKKIGNVVKCIFNLTGTSGGTDYTVAQFTLPYVNNTGMDVMNSCVGVMGTIQQISYAIITAGSAILRIYRTTAAPAWASSGTTKTCQGQIIFQN